MLSLIRVKNYAVIDEIEVEFGDGLNVMTGETGAGKSILVDALGLALGDRADATAVRHGAERAEISVSFDVPARQDRKSTRLNSSHSQISYAVFCLKKKKTKHHE